MKKWILALICVSGATAFADGKILKTMNCVGEKAVLSIQVDQTNVTWVYQDNQSNAAESFMGFILLPEAGTTLVSFSSTDLGSQLTVQGKNAVLIFEDDPAVSLKFKCQ